MTLANAQNSWAISLYLHALLAAAALFLALRAPLHPTEKIEVTVIDRPAPAPAIPQPQTPHARVEAEVKPRAVFGVSRDSHTSDDSNVAVKPGNTVAKPQDNETLRPDDADSLPTPTDEYLVSQMPTLADEVRIPYPPQARQKGVQGAVTMDLLIDADGKVRDAKLIEGPGAGLAEAAMGAIHRFKFKPALVDGKPVAVRIRYAYRFILEH